MSNYRQAVEVLEALKELFSDRSNWNSGSLVNINPVRDFSYSTSYGDNSTYCLVGGLAKVKGKTADEIRRNGKEAYRMALNSDGSGPLLFAAAKTFLARKIEKAVDDNEPTGQIRKHAIVSQNIQTPADIYKINDDYGYDAVMEVIDIAIASGNRAIALENGETFSPAPY